MLNAQWLETFTVLCETGHFTRAAERLGMTQPGVSQHLRKLENQVGQALISSQGKRFSRTPAGEAVLALGRARREEERQLRQAIQNDDPDVGDVAIACSGSFAMLVYPQLLALMKTAPHLSLRLEAMPQERVVKGVLDGKFDLGVTNQEPSHPRLDASSLGREELCLLLPASAPRGDIGLAALEDIGFIAHPDGYAYADELFSLNFPEEFKGSDRLRVRGFVNQISQIPTPVAQGIGYTLLPRSGLDAYPDRQKLRVANLARERKFELWSIFQRGRILPKRVQRISELIRQIAGRLEDA
ncbi:LysR family transcriptional regulator [Mesorhizobium sp. 10J20-29]